PLYSLPSITSSLTSFFFSSSVYLPLLPSFPTRRSSDLNLPVRTCLTAGHPDSRCFRAPVLPRKSSTPFAKESNPEKSPSAQSWARKLHLRHLLALAARSSAKRYVPRQRWD